MSLSLNLLRISSAGTASRNGATIPPLPEVDRTLVSPMAGVCVYDNVSLLGPEVSRNAFLLHRFVILTKGVGAQQEHWDRNQVGESYCKTIEPPHVDSASSLDSV